jgi:hypothetical protein
VRVFRPLPRHDRIIINPGGQTPLSLNYTEQRSYNFHHHVGAGGQDYAPQHYGGGNGYLVRRHHRRINHAGDGAKR